MGITVNHLNFFYESLEHVLPVPNYKGMRICELGNQIMEYDTTLEKFVVGHPRTGKEYFSNMGFFHISLDISGKDGSIPINLTKPIPHIFREFDVVTNFGTTEYFPAKYQSMAFANIHCLLKVGGIAVHVVPKQGPFQYTEKFFEDLCKGYDYFVVLPAKERLTLPDHISVCLMKQ